MTIIPFIFLILSNYSLSILSKKTFGRCMPLTIIIIMAMLFFSQLFFHTFNFGYYSLALFGILSIPLFLRYRKKTDNELLIPKGLFVFLGICLFVFIWDFNRSFAIFDEYYFWGPMVKESLRLDAFYSSPDSVILLHKDYPPFITLFEMFWCKISGGYSESAISMSIHTFLLSISVLPIVEQLFVAKTRKIHFFSFGFLSSIVFLVFIAVLDPWTPRVFASILVDILVAIIFSYAMYLVYKKTAEKSKFGIFELAAINTSIIMIKQIGIGFVLVILFYGLFKGLLNKEKHPSYYFRYIIAFIIPVAFYAYWSILTKTQNIHGQFDASNISIKKFMVFLLNNNNSLQNSTLHNYFHALFEKNITSSWISIGYFSAFLIACLLLILIAHRLSPKMNRKEFFSILASFICCTFGFAFTMAILYVFCFNEAEMQSLASYERYMSSYILGLFVFLLYIAIEKNKNLFSSVKKTYYALFIVFAFASILAPVNIEYMVKQPFSDDAFKNEKQDARLIKEKTKDSSTICTVYDCSTSKYKWYGSYPSLVAYYANPRFFELNYDLFYFDLKNAEIRNTVTNAVRQCDYLFIKQYNKNVEEYLSKYLGRNQLESNAIYRIKKTDTAFSLHKCK